MSKIKLEVVTPERLVVREEVDSVTIPAASGEVGILPMHTTLLTALGEGRLCYTASGAVKSLDLKGGVAEVINDKVTVLADEVSQ